MRVDYPRIIKESEEELKKLLKKEKDVRKYRKIKAIYLLKTIPNATLGKAAERLDLKYQTIKEYWREYREGGIERVSTLQYKGRIPRLSKEEFERFKEKAKEGFESLKEMQEWIREEFNKELSIKTISYWCKKLGIKKKGQTFEYQER